MGTRSVKEFWLVNALSDDHLRMDDGSKGFRWSWCDPPYDECDFEGLDGLVVLEGLVHERPSEPQSDDEDAPNYWPHGSYDEWYEATWRQATMEEAQALGFFGAPVPEASR